MIISLTTHLLCDKVKQHNVFKCLAGSIPVMKEKEAEEEFTGEWLLLFNDEIIDHSSNVEEILKLAEEKFPEEKFPNDTVKISKVIQGSPRGAL
jgi:hypothetical protein